MNWFGAWLGRWTLTWRDPSTLKWGLALDDGLKTYFKVGL